MLIANNVTHSGDNQVVDRTPVVHAGTRTEAHVPGTVSPAADSSTSLDGTECLVTSKQGYESAARDVAQAWVRVVEDLRCSRTVGASARAELQVSTAVVMTPSNQASVHQGSKGLARGKVLPQGPCQCRLSRRC